MASFDKELLRSMAVFEELPQVYVEALFLIWLILALMSFRFCVRSQF